MQRQSELKKTMPHLAPHTDEEAKESAREQLSELKNKLGSVPHMYLTSRFNIDFGVELPLAELTS